MRNSCTVLGKRGLSEIGLINFPKLKKIKEAVCFESLEREGKIAEIRDMALSFYEAERQEVQIDRGFHVVVKYDPDVDIGKLENQVFRCAELCGKQHLVVPTKSISVPGKDKGIALQLWLNGDEFITLSNYLEEKIPEGICTFEKIAEAVLFEFIFGMRVCTEENLIFNKLNGDIIHPNNQYSWRAPNNIVEEDEEEIPFTSALLSLSEAHRPLDTEQYKLLRGEIENYESKINELNKFLINENVDQKIISSLRERIDLFFINIEKTNCGPTLADVIISTNKDCKKIIFLKLALLIIDQIKEDLGSFQNISKSIFFEKIKKEVFSSSCTFSDSWSDLITEIEQKDLNMDIIPKVESLLELNMDEFVSEISLYLMSEEVSNLINLSNEEISTDPTDNYEVNIIPLI